MAVRNYGPIMCRDNHLAKKGDVIDGHKHTFDHVTIVISGAVHVRGLLPGGKTKEGEFRAGQIITILKDVDHLITATEDNTLILCVYSHRTANGEIVEHYDPWGEQAGAYV